MDDLKSISEAGTMSRVESIVSIRFVGAIKIRRDAFADNHVVCCVVLLQTREDTNSTNASPIPLTIDSEVQDALAYFAVGLPRA